MITSFANKACGLLLFAIFSLAAKAQLKADFTATPASGCTPLLVQFQDHSAGIPTQWKWDLGNGTISFLPGPSATYFNPGLYTVKLIVKNSTGADSIVKTQFINVSAKPSVEFSAAITTGCFPLTVKFTDYSTGGNDKIATWQWDFGDGFSSNVQNPSHVYTNSGNYNVTLRVINSRGCLNTVSKEQYIQISPAPKANFSNSIPTACSTPVTINFQNLSEGTGVLTYEWLFGDGSTSTLPDPSHIYTAPGTYTVKLVATNGSGCRDTLIKTNAFTIGNVSTSFTASDKVCVGGPLVLNNTSNPAPGSANWSFGDSTFSTQINPVKIYKTPGTYQVKLVANFGSCPDSSFKTVTVIAAPTASFTATDTASCSFPFKVTFTNNSLNAVSYQWDFGDNATSTLESPSHDYKSYGNFKVTLVVTGENGCSDTLRKLSYVTVIKPTITFTNLPDSGCVPFMKSFTSKVTSLNPVTGYFWDFGDGATATDSTPTHTYTATGGFAVKLIISTAGGCSDTAIISRGIVTNGRPKAAFSGDPVNSCAKFPIQFTDKTIGSASLWLWDFGDGTTSTSINPKHLYFDTGYFDIRLTVWDSGCPDTVSYKKYIHINPPIASFVVSLNCDKPLEKIFTNQSIGADEWNWDFGDGSTSLDKSPVHTYAGPAIYNVSLTVRNHASGCDFTIVKPIPVINAKATFFASDTIICRGRAITFNTGLSLTEVQTFEWDFGDGKTFSSTQSTSATHLYAESGNYTVRLIITNILGCKDSLAKTSYIRIDGPTAKFKPSVPGSCLNSLISFNDASVSDSVHAIETWSWNYGDGTKERLSAAPFQHNYSAPGAYIVTLKVTDSKGCSDSANITTALIISKPVAIFNPRDTVTCPSKLIVFNNLSTGPGLGYLWSFGDGDTSTLQNPQHGYASDGAYSVKLFIKDLYGCTDSITKPGVISIVTPVAKFTMSDSFSICPPLIVQFKNLSLYAVSQKWNFGDGTSSTAADPSHFYSYPGTYTVLLTVTAIGGCTSVMKKDIVINGPKGTFTYDPKAGCNPVKINFIATTLDRISFIWDYNDGATIRTTDSVISHTYVNAGIYLPKMILVDKNGCQVPINGKDTITVDDVTAKFSFLDKIVCDIGNVSFTDLSQSNDIITGYKWSLGDGSTSTLQNPQHVYATPGVFFPKLIVSTRNGCIDTMLSPIPVKVASSPQISMTSTANGCTPLVVTFKGLVTVPDTARLSWSWNLGNGNTASLQNPAVQNYTIAGIYNPSVIVTNSSGCKDTATKAIEAFLIPSVSAGRDTVICSKSGIMLQATGALNYSWNPSPGLSCLDCANPVATPDSSKTFMVKGTSLQGCSAHDAVFVKVQFPFTLRYSKPDTVCKGQSVHLFASGTDRFQWSPATAFDNSAIALPVARPDTTITYRVIGSDNQGCFKDTGFVFVKVYPIPTVSAGADKTINIGQSMDLIPIISPDVTTVTWSPTGNIFRNTYPAISIKPGQTTQYTVEVKNRGGCMARDNVTVFVICNGSNVFIPNTFSPNGDGANDIFYPRGTGLFKIRMLRIFNRWGEVVFEKTDFNPNDPAFGWDGTYKGVKSGADVFVYMIDIMCDNNSLLTYKGNVALIQ